MKKMVTLINDLAKSDTFEYLDEYVDKEMHFVRFVLPSGRARRINLNIIREIIYYTTE